MPTEKTTWSLSDWAAGQPENTVFASLWQSRDAIDQPGMVVIDGDMIWVSRTEGHIIAATHETFGEVLEILAAWAADPELPRFGEHEAGAIGRHLEQSLRSARR